MQALITYEIQQEHEDDHKVSKYRLKVSRKMEDDNYEKGISELAKGCRANIKMKK